MINYCFIFLIFVANAIGFEIQAKTHKENQSNGKCVYTTYKQKKNEIMFYLTVLSMRFYFLHSFILNIVFFLYFNEMDIICN